MSDLERKPPYSIPTETDFVAAAELTDETFESNGGAWTYYHKTSLVDIHSNAQTKNLLTAMSSQARFIEPLQDETLSPVDPMYRATHAFRAGMWTGGFITKYLHQDAISYLAVHNTITQSFPHSNFKGQEEHEENAQFLRAIADQGLDLAGYETREYLDKWGNEIVSSEDARRYYALGAGAVFYVSQGLYTQLHERLQQDYEISLLSDEVSQYLASVRDSSDK